MTISDPYPPCRCYGHDIFRADNSQEIVEQLKLLVTELRNIVDMMGTINPTAALAHALVRASEREANDEAG